MFFQWRYAPSRFRTCYIGTAMPDDPAKAIAANKTYTSSGSLEGIKVWLVETPPLDSPTMKNLSWATRLERLGLLGTIAFYNMNEPENVEKLGLEDGWQLEVPTLRFECWQGGSITIEVTCETCYLEFDQLFSLPPLGECAPL